MNRKRYPLELAFALVALFSQNSFAAGNVNVSLKKGEVVVRGDNQANFVAIEENFVEGGGVTVSVFDGLEDGTTTINGSSQPFVLSFPSAAPGFDIDLKAGHDVLDLRESFFPAWLHIRMGSGNDILVGMDVTATADSTIDMGSGDDAIAVEFFVFGGDLQVTMGSGSDLLRTRFSTVLGQLILEGGSGEDTLVGDIAVREPASIRGFETAVPLLTSTKPQ